MPNNQLEDDVLDGLENIEEEKDVVYDLLADKEDSDEEMVYEDPDGRQDHSVNDSDTEISFDDDTEEALSNSDAEIDDIDELDPMELMSAINKAKKETDDNPPDSLLVAESEMRGSSKIEISTMQSLVQMLNDPSIKLLNQGKSFKIKDELKPSLYMLIN